jgi:hypothetical protein
MTDTEQSLAQARRDLEISKEKQAEAAQRMADCAGSPHQFDRARAARDAASNEVERIELHWQSLRQQLEDECERTRAEAPCRLGSRSDWAGY